MSATRTDWRGAIRNRQLGFNITLSATYAAVKLSPAVYLPVQQARSICLDTPMQYFDLPKPLPKKGRYHEGLGYVPTNLELEKARNEYEELFAPLPEDMKMAATVQNAYRFYKSSIKRMKQGPGVPLNGYKTADDRIQKFDKFDMSSFKRQQDGPGLQKDYKPNDERTLRLGKTLRTLQPLLPTLLITPLPTSILSPQIALHLFPSTHPHLPVVHGRVAYMAALWTSPLAWGRVPLIGNVRLEILSERMVRGPFLENLPSTDSESGTSASDEQLVVRWKTVGPATSSKLFSSAAKMANLARKGASLSGGAKGPDGQIVETQGEERSFEGLFVFAFDEEGRVKRHVIEHVMEHGEWEKSAGARVVGLTDWLLRGLAREGPAPGGLGC